MAVTKMYAMPLRIDAAIKVPAAKSQSWAFLTTFIRNSPPWASNSSLLVQFLVKAIAEGFKVLGITTARGDRRLMLEDPSRRARRFVSASVRAT